VSCNVTICESKNRRTQTKRQASAVRVESCIEPHVKKAREICLQNGELNNSTRKLLKEPRKIHCESLRNRGKKSRWSFAEQAPEGSPDSCISEMVHVRSPPRPHPRILNIPLCRLRRFFHVADHRMESVGGSLNTKSRQTKHSPEPEAQSISAEVHASPAKITMRNHQRSTMPEVTVTVLGFLLDTAL
jgi:hypothetical protein